jgi:predicted RNA binding protein YcfA (HicA-like mRNA interferase family)
MRVREIVKILKKDGWYELKNKPGSHRQFKHPSKKGKVTVAEHSGDILPTTLRSIKAQAELK